MVSVDGFLLRLSAALDAPSPDEEASLEVTSGHTAITLGLDSTVPPQPSRHSRRAIAQGGDGDSGFL